MHVGMVVRRIAFIDRLDEAGVPVVPPRFDVSVMYAHSGFVSEWSVPDASA